MTRIADEYSFIAKRMAEIAQDRAPAQFFIPEGIVIQMDDALRKLPECDVAFVVDVMRCRLMITQLRRHRPDFIEFFLRCFPSAKVINNAITLSSEDMKLLVQRMRFLTG